MAASLVNLPKSWFCKRFLQSFSPWNRRLSNITAVCFLPEKPFLCVVWVQPQRVHVVMDPQADIAACFPFLIRRRHAIHNSDSTLSSDSSSSDSSSTFQRRRSKTRSKPVNRWAGSALLSRVLGTCTVHTSAQTLSVTSMTSQQASIWLPYSCKPKY